MFTSELGPILSPIQILDTRTIIQGTTHIPQLLIQWENINPNEATWEDLEDIAVGYPNLNLEDKVPFKGEGIVTCRERQTTKNAEVDVEGDNKHADTKKDKNGKLVTIEGQLAADPNNEGSGGATD